MKFILSISLAVLLFATSCQSQIKNEKIETAKIFGNCDMCKATIEKAGYKKKEYKTDWNVNTKLATITYNSETTTSDAVLKNIALAGYDNEKYLAPDEAYAKLASCCKYDRAKKVVTKPAVVAKSAIKDSVKLETDHSQHTPEKQEAVKQESNQLQPVFDKYFAVKDALVKSDGAKASASAAELLASLNAVKMENLKSEEHTVWMKVEKDLKANAQSMSETKNPKQQRSHLATLSKSMYELIKVVDPVEKVYYQNCPMYNNGRGANWLSKENAIRNPYYGQEMLTCGKTIETIK